MGSPHTDRGRHDATTPSPRAATTACTVNGALRRGGRGRGGRFLDNAKPDSPRASGGLTGRPPFRIERLDRMLVAQTQRMRSRGTPDSSEGPQSFGRRAAQIKVPVEW